MSEQLVGYHGRLFQILRRNTRFFYENTLISCSKKHPPRCFCVFLFCFAVAAGVAHDTSVT